MWSVRYNPGVLTRSLSLLLLSTTLAACDPVPAVPEVVPTDTPAAPAPTPTSTATTAAPTPTLIPEWEFSNLKAEGSTVVVELRWFAAVDVRVTLDGRQPDEVTVKENILRHVFEGVAPGKHTVTASDVTGFSDSREIVVDPPPETPAPTRASLPTNTATSVPEPTATLPVASTGTWRGLVIAPEHRCADYDSDDYPYRPTVEPHIVASMGGIVYGPYTGTWFDSTSETDIEHIVARSEAHDSGLCAADEATKRRFASDLLNLTLASPTVNRHRKSGKDAAEWLPDLNQCWFTNRVVKVRQAYTLTVDRRERDVLEGILSGCASTEMVVGKGRPAPTATLSPSSAGETGTDALRLYDDNGNGRITCSEARVHGIAPVRRGHPAYPFMDDRDNDGVVCE